MGSGEPMLISGNEQNVRSCLFITKGIRIGMLAHPDDGVIWH